MSYSIIAEPYSDVNTIASKPYSDVIVITSSIAAGETYVFEAYF